jgi:hypothetical protein
MPDYGPTHSSLPFSFHDFAGSGFPNPPAHDIVGSGGGGGVYGPTHSSLPFSFHDLNGNADNDAEQLAVTFCEGDVSLVNPTWKPVPIGGMAVRPRANIPITVHYLASQKCEPFDILMDEIVMTEAADSGSNFRETKFKMGIAAINRWLSPRGLGYADFLNRHTFDTFAEDCWSNLWVEITKPSKDSTANKDESMVCSGLARTRNMWSFQQYVEGAPADQAPAIGLRPGDHLFLLARRRRDEMLPVWNARRTLTNLQSDKWHWELVPHACQNPIPAYLTYNSEFMGMYDGNQWSGRFFHVGTYLRTVEQERPNARNYPNLARQYLFADSGKIGYESWVKLQKIEVVMRRSA